MASGLFGSLGSRNLACVTVARPRSTSGRAGGIKTGGIKKSHTATAVATAIAPAASMAAVRRIECPGPAQSGVVSPDPVSFNGGNPGVSSVA